MSESPIGWRNHVGAGVSADELDVVRHGSLPASWSARWAADPAAATLFVNAGGHPSDTSRWVSARELDERTREVARKLAGLGLERGSRILWSADRSLSSVIACIAVLRAGFVLVPLDTALADREVLHVIDEVKPGAAIVDDRDRLRLINAGSLEAGVDLVVIDTSVDLHDSTRVDRAAALPSKGDQIDAPIDLCERDAPALIGFTSGTTGAPKGAVLTHANLLANAESLRLAWKWTPEDRLVHALPLFHGHGLCAALFGTLHAGATAVIVGGFDPGVVFDAIDEHRATLFFGVPTMYHRLAGSSRCAELSKLRIAVSGSAPLAAELHREIEIQSGVRVLERYGMTETLLTVSNPLEGERRAGSIGFPLPGTEAILGEALSEEDSSDSALAGLEGGTELAVRGPTVFAGYFGKPAQTAERMNDGWFSTGDVGVVEDGYVRLLGRLTEVVITGGHNVYPAEVEDVLSEWPEVVEVAVSGTPSDEWGEVVTAWVVGSDGPIDMDALLAHAATKLSPYKRPRLIRQVDALPRNSMGKVQRRSLR